MKRIITTILLATAFVHASAQNQANDVEQARQSARLVMSNAIDITFSATNSNAGGTVSLVFDDINDFANGVNSSPYQIKVRSNKRFRVQAKTNASRFTYTGNTSPAPQMNVSNILFLKVTNNSTGGSVSSNFNNKFRTLSSSNQTLISNGTAGGNKTFNVEYRANPGYNFPAGTYSVNVIYTATQQ